MNKKNLVIIIMVLLGVSFLAMRNGDQEKPQTDSIQYVKIAGQSIKVSVVLTGPEQEQGLSGRTGLKENEGMLFSFSHPDKYLFWMKDMNFPIDIIWLAPSEGGDGEAKVVYIKKDARPESYPAAYGPTEYTQFVLEVSSGFSDKNNLQVGDTVEFTY